MLTAVDRQNAEERVVDRVCDANGRHRRPQSQFFLLAPRHILAEPTPHPRTDREGHEPHGDEMGVRPAGHQHTKKKRSESDPCAQRHSASSMQERQNSGECEEKEDRVGPRLLRHHHMERTHRQEHGGGDARERTGHPADPPPEKKHAARAEDRRRKPYPPIALRQAQSLKPPSDPIIERRLTLHSRRNYDSA